MQGDTGESGKFDAEDPNVIEFLKRTVIEYFNRPVSFSNFTIAMPTDIKLIVFFLFQDVIKRYQARVEKEMNCSQCPSLKKPACPIDAVKVEEPEDILKSLRKISYGVRR